MIGCGSSSILRGLRCRTGAEKVSSLLRLVCRYCRLVGSYFCLQNSPRRASGKEGLIRKYAEGDKKSI